MSDFDKEAEREKLRKKYARDEEKRAHTQRMSELLLQGATMTSSHCEQCGDPLFRHNGQTFCASCQADNGQSAAHNAATTADDDAGNDPSTVDVAVDTAAGDVAADTVGNRAAAGDTAGTNTTAPSGPAPPNRAVNAAAPPGTNAASNTADSASQADLTAARHSLERTVARFASQAESTDDPRRARELLAAAREAAETLDALD